MLLGSEKGGIPLREHEEFTVGILEEVPLLHPVVVDIEGLGRSLFILSILKIIDSKSENQFLNYYLTRVPKDFLF